MKAFCHINEFHFTGYRLLSMMLLIFEQTYIWAPRVNIQTQSKGLLSPDNLISIIKNRDSPLRVMARHDWLKSENSRRNFTEETAKYMGIDPWWENWEKFDSDLSGFYADDDDKPFEERRVIGIERERGWDWAAKQLENKSTSYEYARAKLSFERGDFPPGLQAKANEVYEMAKKSKEPFPEDAAIKQLLRDVCNHEDALLESGADMPVEPYKNPTVVPDIANRPLTTLQDRPPDPAQLVPLLEAALNIADIRRADGLMDLLADTSRLEFIREGLPELLVADPVVASGGDALLRRVEKELESEGRPSNLVEEILAVALGAIASVTMPPWLSSIPTIMLRLIPLPKKYADRDNQKRIIRGNAPKHGDLEIIGAPTAKWLSALTGTQDWKRAREIHRIVQRLRKYVRKTKFRE